MLVLEGWAVFNLHGTMYSSGLPDIYCCHISYGTRWVEVKMPIKHAFTPAQLKVFPELESKGVGVWVLTAATKYEYDKLFGPSNWHMFLSIMKQGHH